MDQEVTSENNRFKHSVNFVKHTKRRRSLPSPAQLQVHFVCHTLHQYFNKLSCSSENSTRIHYLEETSEETCQFDLRAVLNLDDLLSNFSPILSEFGITEDSDDHRQIVSNIRFSGQRFGRDVIHKEESRGLFTLEVSISREHNMYRCESCLLDRVVRESIIMAEESERVTVPASQSSIKKLLKKRVRVEEGEFCSVCLEEFRVGTYETSMDCSHVFHRECIERWLRQSHYCPVCRYEMPTDYDRGEFHEDDEY
ncbi:putative aminoacyltransferase, E1 ubiquitin-activating enzyme [Rosa chinensis]|uniref:RING-type E3 ubiquitin transferase n=1 Tax=Rosa chinensis TaxID=74649 RepID=A0A2P6R5D2_ROSCH|nr:putative aminoacyltransferase, E1 ubiquitin-activating enzyme [Rosa chinensis]